MNLIVSEALFYNVQEILEGKKRIQLVKMKTDDSLPLRGFLLCPKYGKQLTESASKGRHTIITTIAFLFVG
jgi:site-specific DNA recombinase